MFFYMVGHALGGCVELGHTADYHLGDMSFPLDGGVRSFPCSEAVFNFIYYVRPGVGSIRAVAALRTEVVCSFAVFEDSDIIFKGMLRIGVYFPIFIDALSVVGGANRDYDGFLLIELCARRAAPYIKDLM